MAPRHLGCQSSQSHCMFLFLHFLDLPLRTLGCCVRVLVVPKEPPPPNSAGELTGAAPMRLLPVPPAKPEAAGLDAAPKPPNRPWPAPPGVPAGCGGPRASGVPCAGLACIAASQEIMCCCQFSGNHQPGVYAFGHVIPCIMLGPSMMARLNSRGGMQAEGTPQSSLHIPHPGQCT